MFLMEKQVCQTILCLGLCLYIREKGRIGLTKTSCFPLPVTNVQSIWRNVCGELELFAYIDIRSTTSNSKYYPNGDDIRLIYHLTFKLGLNNI